MKEAKQKGHPNLLVKHLPKIHEIVVIVTLKRMVDEVKKELTPHIRPIYNCPFTFT